MGKIRMLSESMIGKIAAGEVVERPVSAIKELIENSLDAGSSAITAEIREGGLTYIRVTDNGSGIEESDLRLAFERHATSKISREQDLYSIQTLGFRGEALASIAAVSHVVMTTRTAQHETGLKVTNEGGKITKIEESACTVGTTIIVTDLFFNTPVRKGFMKKASAEASAVTEVLTQFILSRPDVSFRYLNGGKTMYHSPGDGQLASAVHAVFGGQAMKTMRKVEGHANGVLLKGYVGIGENARGNRGQEYFFINGRMMHSSLLSGALETACRERVMIGKFPVCALHLQIAYEAVDVNVHPNKLEVRFRDEQAVCEAVTGLVTEALREADAFEKPVEMVFAPQKTEQVPNMPSREQLREGIRKHHAEISVSATLPPQARKQPAESPKAEPVLRESGMAQRQAFDMPGVPGKENHSVQVVPTPKPTAETTADLPMREEKAEQVNTILPQIRKPLKVFGALFNTYILAEYEDQLMMVDQHAVHERLLFDRLMKEQQTQQAGQEMLVPLVLSVTKKEQELLEENREALESIGLVIEAFGAQDAAVRSIPMVLGEPETAGFVRDVLSELETGRGISLEKKRAVLLQTACKHAVKGGERLTEDQLRSLLEEMLEKHVTPTCPHGRPLVVMISHRELDRKFKRIQD
ncbi:MAG: DNA mismatch repair endonuclease MutL [Clostridia bacterium]|nr:DNA mismatch repair endonuclease MutL [Clostridia bacterium]